MSIEVSKFYWDQCTDVKGSERLVILALADYCNESGWCFPSVPELARRCQLSDRGTQKILARLAAGGHIAVEANEGMRKTQRLADPQLPPAGLPTQHRPARQGEPTAFTLATVHA